MSVGASSVDRALCMGPESTWPGAMSPLHANGVVHTGNGVADVEDSPIKAFYAGRCVAVPYRHHHARPPTLVLACVARLRICAHGLPAWLARHHPALCSAACALLVRGMSTLRGLGGRGQRQSLRDACWTRAACLPCLSTTAFFGVHAHGVWTCVATASSTRAHRRHCHWNRASCSLDPCVAARFACRGAAVCRNLGD